MKSARPDAERLRTWRAFLQAHAALVGRLEEELRHSHNITLASYEVLLHLAEAPGGRLRMQDLVGCTLMSKSGVTRLIDRMESEGLLCRESCPSDRRGAYAVLSPEGRRRLRRAAPTHLEGIQRHFAAHLSHDEAAAMEAGLTRVLAALGVSEGRRDAPAGCQGGGGGAAPARTAPP